MDLPYDAPWRLPFGPAPDPDYLPEVPPPLRDILWYRGYRDEAAARAFLDPWAYQLPEHLLAPDLDVAADRLLLALERGERLGVWGDYDADGQTATAVLVGALRRLGYDVLFRLSRCDNGPRGLSAEGIADLAEAGCSLLVTCDCATNDREGVAFARARGMDVLITDHHRPSGELPAALAIVNPARLSEDDPLRALPGVAVAYLLARAVARRLDRPLEAQRELDLVAVGIVADLAPTSVATRALLARGVTALWRSPRPGVAALLRRARREPQRLDTRTIGFTLAPALNAVGKMADAAEGVALLLADTADEAEALAARVWDYKLKRSALAESLEATIDAQLAGEPTAAALFAVGEGWHAGLLGLAANHLARRHARPAVIISHPRDGSLARGSIRGDGAIDVLGLLARQEDALAWSGGHRGAAGFGIETSRIPAFRAAFLAHAAAVAIPARPPSLGIDAIVDWHTMRPADLYDLLQALAPFTEGNPQPVLASRGLTLHARRAMGDQGLHERLALADPRGATRDVLWWNADRGWRPEGGLDVAYTLDWELWQGRPNVRLILQGLRTYVEDSDNR